MKKITCCFSLLIALVLLFSGCSQPTAVVPTVLPAATQGPLPTTTPTLVQTPLPQPVSAMFRGGLEHSGVFAAEGAAVEWIYPVEAQLLSSPFVATEAVYIGARDGYLHAIDRNTGQEKWKFNAGSTVDCSPTLLDGVLYFGSEAGDLFAVDSQTGQENWRFKTQGPIISAPSIVNGVIFFGSLDTYLYALDQQTGQEKWKFQTQGPIISSPAVAGGAVLFGSGDGAFYALDQASGKRKWLFLAKGEIDASPAVVDGTVYFGSNAGYLFAVDLQTGEEKWNFQAQAEVISSPAVSGGIVYFGSIDGNLYAIDANRGQEKWRFQTGGGIVSSPAITPDGVYFGSTDGAIYAVDPVTGQEEWRFQTQDEVWSSPSVAGDIIYTAGFDGNLYALHRQGPQIALAPTATPRPLQPTPTLLPAPGEPVAAGTGGLPWWNDRVFYEVFVRSFYDSDGDGTGDLQGLISKLDYLNDGDPNTDQDLGVTGIWLMPVTESPSYHGYDVVDYKQIEQDYGKNEDLKTLIAEAHRRDMLVIVDLVMNHTSSQHPWFINAQAPGSEHERWYIWSTEPPDYSSPWGTPVWYRLGGRYYYALFWEGMPDLNFNNGAVTEAMFDIICYWLEEMGVDGFRLDAVKHLIEDQEIQENTPYTHEWLQNFHRFVRTVKAEAFTVGEAWTQTDEVLKYIGDEVDIAFEFDLASAILASTLRGDNFDLVEAQSNILENFPQGQYAVFLTNHDQNRVMNQLLNTIDSAKVAATLLLTNPGVPFIYYGEEVGMRGAKPDEHIRTPMQWDSSPTAGFTTGTPWQELSSGYEALNVETQDADPDSLLNHYRALVELRNAHPALRTGDMQLVNSDTRKIYSYIRYNDSQAFLVIVNLSKDPLSDYQLWLDHGPLSGRLRAQLLLGQGQPTIPVLNAGGGFDAYTPLPMLQPRSSLIIQLNP